MSLYSRIKKEHERIEKIETEYNYITNPGSPWFTPVGRPTLEESKIIKEIYDRWRYQQNGPVTEKFVFGTCYDVGKKIENFVLWGEGEIDSLL